MKTDEMIVDISQDWALACDVQEAFMQAPCTVSNSFDYSARCRQVRALGGDCYNFIAHKDDCLALVVGDASGKGLAAALMIANVQSSLRTAALFTGDDLAALLKVVNHQAHASSSEDRYATLFYGVFDGSTRSLRYVNAGHNPALVLRSGGAVAWLEASAPPVGLFAESVYQAQAVQLNPGDLIVAYTDGFVEATNTAGEEWGVEGLLATIKRCRTQQPESIVEAAFAALDEFSGDNQTDDATILAALVY